MVLWMIDPTQNIQAIDIFQPVQNNVSHLNEHMLSVQCSLYSPVHSYRSACNKLQTSWASLGQLLASLGQSVATHWPLATSRVCISVPKQSLSQPWWRCNSTTDKHKLPPVTSLIPGYIHSIDTLVNNHSMLQVFINSPDFGVLGGLREFFLCLVKGC